ncbi:oxygenase MpaB family protein [Nocardia brasiliensis]|uniref:oxygenase MpaB family protein n=1 Tax=Nocardia brasiliensis TaxID=37326 RepID=UPI0037909E42
MAHTRSRIEALRTIADQHLVKDPARVAEVRYAPRPDHGFYGPDSLTWRAAEHPLSLVLAIYRGAIEVLFDPAVAESVSTHSVMETDPLTRARRSIMFFQMAAFGDSESATRAGRTLYRVHSHINGYDPISHQQYSGTDVGMALWTHSLGLVGIMECYEQFGEGFSASEKDEFIRENIPFAQLVGVAPEDAPTNLVEARKIAEDWYPQMALGLKGRSDVDFLLRSPRTPAWPMAVAGPVLRVVAVALARHLAPELRDMARFHPSEISIWLAEKVVRTVNQLVKLPGRSSRPAMLVSPEGYGMMLNALEAPRDLPLADPALREDLHLRVRAAGPGNKHSDLEHSPFVQNQAEATVS